MGRERERERSNRRRKWEERNYIGGGGERANANEKKLRRRIKS